jgi:hypothetical protein
VPRFLLTLLSLAVATGPTVLAETLSVPKQHETIQAAIDASEPGDTVLVTAGSYTERIRFKPGITVRSQGDDSKGRVGLRRAELTIIDGGGDRGDEPGVLMAEGCTIDGFTITRVGVYDEELWQRHFESHGEELGDDEGSVHAEGTIPAISIRAATCNVVNNIVHHNGDVGIAVIGNESDRTDATIASNVAFRNLGGGIGIAENASPIVQDNSCFENLRAGIGCRNASPLILGNRCFRNIRAGIGCRESAKPIIRENICYQNRRAGIGIRTPGTAPIVEDNECFENDMAGIGSRDGAQPIISRNRCDRNKMAGIGADGSNPLISDNVCRENMMAGIGISGGASATIHNNRCDANKLVAIGVTQGSTALITGNELSRTGGGPPIIAVRDGSRATINENQIKGGGVAAVLIEGTVVVNQNRFIGVGSKQGNAVWVWAASTAKVSSNSFDGYRTSVSASKADVVISGNRVRDFDKTAIIVKDSTQPAHVFGNTAFSSDPEAQAVIIEGSAGIISDNDVRSPSPGEVEP